MKNKFVVNVDTQADFIFKGFALPVEGAEAVVSKLLRWNASLNPDEIAGVLNTFDTHTEETFIGSPENLGNPEVGAPGFNLHCEKGTPGWENVINPALINFAIPVYALEKGVFNMWEEDKLYLRDLRLALTNSYYDRDEFFADLKAQGVDTIIITGFAADFCVFWAIEGFLKRGFKVIVMADLTKGIVRDMQQVILEEFPGNENLTFAHAYPHED
jgi:nicotinamidase/pyrazinamidase